MNCWDEVMQDDVYLIATEGWQTGRTIRTTYDKETPDFTIKKGQKTLKYIGELIPASLMIKRFFPNLRRELERLEGEIVKLVQRKKEFEGEYTPDGEVLSGLEGKSGITKDNVLQRVLGLKETIMGAYSEATLEHNQVKDIKKSTFGIRGWTKNIGDEEGLFEEMDVLYDYLQLMNDYTSQKKLYKQTLDALHKSVIEKYRVLTEAEIKTFVVEDKWLTGIRVAIENEVQQLSCQLVAYINKLEERYARPLPELEREVKMSGEKVEGHLTKMGVA